MFAASPIHNTMSSDVRKVRVQPGIPVVVSLGCLLPLACRIRSTQGIAQAGQYRQRDFDILSGSPRSAHFRGRIGERTDYGDCPTRPNGSVSPSFFSITMDRAETSRATRRLFAKATGVSGLAPRR